MPALFARLYGNPYFVLPAASLMWAGNSIVGRVAIGHISPMSLTCLRWLFVCLLLVAFYRRPALAVLPVLRGRWPWVIGMASIGFTAFNALLYLAAYHTSAVNITMLQSTIPVLVLVGGALLFRTPVAVLQWAGTALTVLGVAVVASGGDLARLAALHFNVGDVFILVASACYAAFTLGLRWRPGGGGMALFAWFALVALVAALPLIAVEVATGGFFWPTWQGWLILAYVTVCPSILSQIFYIRGVELIGPGRAGLFINLIPIFGALMAVFFLREPFGWSDAAAAFLVCAGIGVAETARRR